MLQHRAKLSQIALLHRAVLQGERDRVWVRGNADRRNLQQLLLDVSSLVSGLRVAVLPANRHEPNRRRAKVAAAIKIARNLCERVLARRELPRLQQILPAYPRLQRLANRENDVAILMRVLDHGIT